jgi:hypothetical protein
MRPVAFSQILFPDLLLPSMALYPGQQLFSHSTDSQVIDFVVFHQYW